MNLVKSEPLESRKFLFTFLSPNEVAFADKLTAVWKQTLLNHQQLYSSSYRFLVYEQMLCCEFFTENFVPLNRVNEHVVSVHTDCSLPIDVQSI